MAIGQTNGRVLLTSLLSSADSCPLSGREYTSRHSRQCNTVAWGAAEPYNLAAGFDKHRSEHGLTVWDAKRTGSDSSKPVVEAAFGDTVSSVAWFNQSVHTLVTGVNNKHLRLYDIRGSKNIYE